MAILILLDRHRKTRHSCTAQKRSKWLEADLRQCGEPNTWQALAADTDGPYVCTGCCSQVIFWHVLGSRSYVSGLLIDTRVVALLGLRTRRDLISGQVDNDLMGRQTLGRNISVPCFRSIANSFGLLRFVKRRLQPRLSGRRTPFYVSKCSRPSGPACWRVRRLPYCDACVRKRVRAIHQN